MHREGAGFPPAAVFASHGTICANAALKLRQLAAFQGFTRAAPPVEARADFETFAIWATRFRGCAPQCATDSALNWLTVTHLVRGFLIGH
jgi:hypothetical protein